MSGLDQTSSELKFVDEKFEVIPAPANIKQPSDEGMDAQPTGDTKVSSVPSVNYTEDDLMFMTESIWSLPNIIWDKLPPRDPDKLKKWNNQFYRYCAKKGIDPFEYFFDELPLAIATVGLAGGMWRDYKEQYKNNGKAQSKEDKKLSSDYDHAKELDEKKAKELADKQAAAS